MSNPTPTPTNPVTEITEFLQAILSAFGGTVTGNVSAFVSGLLGFVTSLIAIINPSTVFTTTEKGYVTVAGLAVVAVVAVAHVIMGNKTKQTALNASITALNTHLYNGSSYDQGFAAGLVAAEKKAV